MERNLQTGSEGWAPTPIQYFARSMSSSMFLCSFPDVSYDVFLGTGSYVPITSSGLLFRAVLQGVSAACIQLMRSGGARQGGETCNYFAWATTML